MNFINPPAGLLQNITHQTFFSKLLNHEIGYAIYLPPDYAENTKSYPVVYHIHGFMGNESSDLLPLQKVYRSRQMITVFVNAISSQADYLGALLQIECILMQELIPHIDRLYRTNPTREGRMLSGFSMGGNMAFYYAVKNPEQFGCVTAYAGTYHHLYHKDCATVGAAPEKAPELYHQMMQEKRYLEDHNILCLVRQNSEKIRGKLHIQLHIGTADILFCDNAIMHLYLDCLNIPHVYRIFEGSGHELINILM